MKKEDWKKTFGWRAFEEFSIPAFLLLPLGGVIYFVTESRGPTVGEVIFAVMWEAVFLTWAWRRKVWPFGPWRDGSAKVFQERRREE